MVNAIVMAGTHADKSKLVYGQNKSLVKVDEEPLVTHVLDALNGVKYIDKRAVVGPKEELGKIVRDDVRIIEESKAPKESRRFIENAIHSYNILSPNGERTLFISSDLPLIATETIEDFVLMCDKSKAAFYFSLINTKNIPSYIEQFKKSARFYLKGRGYYRTANMALFDRSKMKNSEQLEAEIAKAFPLRRTTTKLARLCLYCSIAGKYPTETLKYIAGFLTEEDLKSAFRRTPGLDVEFPEIIDPRAAVEVDYEEEYDFLKKNYGWIKEELKDGRNIRNPLIL